jgi:hypothetical protein
MPEFITIGTIFEVCTLGKAPGACIIKHCGFVDYVTLVTGENSIICKKIRSYEMLKMLYHKISVVTESVLFYQ